LKDRAEKSCRGLATPTDIDKKKGTVEGLPGIDSEHGGQDLLDPHGEVVGNGHRRSAHDLDDQSWQRWRLNRSQLLPVFVKNLGNFHFR